MTIQLVPDAEAIVSSFLRGRSEVTALVASRVYTEIPNSPTFPLVRIYRFGGAPLTSYPLHVDQALLQIDCFGGTKSQARTLAETVRAVLVEAAATTLSGGVVTAATFGPLTYLPDPGYTPAKPRYTTDVTVTIHR